MPTRKKDKKEGKEDIAHYTRIDRAMGRVSLAAWCLSREMGEG
jgi:hypothetical protein